MRWGLFLVVGALALGGIAWWMWGGASDAKEAVRAYCSATPRGQSWERAEQRALEAGLEVTPSGSAERLVSAESWGKRFGCRLVIGQGDVVLEAHFGELPRR